MTGDNIKRLQNWLSGHSEIELAMLFGSYATGKERVNSDLDLAIQTIQKQSLTANEIIAYLVPDRKPGFSIPQPKFSLLFLKIIFLNR